MAHKAHLAAPKPLSAREKEDEETRLAERGNEYQGSQARKSHVGTGVGLAWSEEVESAMKELGEGVDSRLVVIVSAALILCLLTSIQYCTFSQSILGRKR